MPCTSVTRRASEGPCAALIDARQYVGLKCLAQPDDHCKDGTCTFDHAHHAYLGPVLERCWDVEEEHPDEGMVRFEWAETARPAGYWYYREAGLQSESVLRRNHRYEEEPDA